MKYQVVGQLEAALPLEDPTYDTLPDPQESERLAAMQITVAGDRGTRKGCVRCERSASPFG